jgi:hypothetical protein
MSRAAPPELSPGESVPQRRLLRSFDGGWRAALREFVVIVAGVLAALGAQAWWENYEELRREQEYLHQLLADTRENERRLDAAITEDSISNRAVARVMRALQTTEAQPPSDSLVEWIMRAGVASDFQPLTGTAGALMMTGDLRLVRNDSLRSRLVAYAGALASEEARQQQLREATLGMIVPMARALPFLRGAFLGEINAADVDVGQLRTDPDVAALLFSIQAGTVNRLAGLKRAREETNRMRRALEAEPTLR